MDCLEYLSNPVKMNRLKVLPLQLGGDMSSRTRVLVVDDEPAIRNSLVAFLENCQFDVSTSDSAEGALDLMSSKT